MDKARSQSMRSVATMQISPIRKAVVALAIGASLSIAAAAPAAAAPPTPGALSLGDSLFPTLGNGGYDAEHYDFDLSFGAAPTDPATGSITMVAGATQALSQFSLDFAGGALGAVSVNGKTARFTREGEKLIITPVKAVKKDTTFVVVMSKFVATAKAFDENDPTSVAFVAGPTGTETAPQPAYAHYAFPLNDHPRDKASYSFRIDAPAGETAVTNGVLVDKRTKKGRTDWTYVQRQPMASELIQIAVGDYDVIDRGTHNGVKLRDVTVRSATAELAPKLAIEADQLDWLTARLGKYPFDVYGSLVTDQNLYFALETQTLSLYATDFFDGVPEESYAPVMLHELLHQWFGDSTSPKDWSDIWLNEGHATYYEYTYAESKGWLEDYAGSPTLDGVVEGLYAAADQARADHGPVAKPLSGSDADIFSSQSYEGGLVVLYALKQKIGDAAFDRLERAWVNKYRGESAGTEDFIDLASQIAGRNLHPFLGAWLYGTTTPPMPNHPDWTVDPVVQESSAVARSAAAELVTINPLQLVRR
jgi:aminopeptidase N